MARRENTATHFEAEVEKLAEMPENIRTRKETLRVAYETSQETSKGPWCRRVNRWTRTRVMPCLRRGLEEVGNLELQELCLRRMAGASRDASTEEIASWSVAADRIALEISGKKKIQEEVEKKTTKDDIKMSGGGMEGLHGSLSS